MNIAKVESTNALRTHHVDPNKPYLLFVGRITRQKGIIHLVRAIEFMDPDFQIVLCAGAPDTPEIAAEMKQRGRTAREARRPDIIWIDEMLDRKTAIELYSHAARFFVVLRSTNRLGLSILKRWPVRRRSWQARSAESRKWWSTAKPDFLFRSSK